MKAGFLGTERITDKHGYTLATHEGSKTTVHSPYGDLLILSPATIPDPTPWAYRDDERLVTVEVYGENSVGENTYAKMDLTEEMIPHLIEALQKLVK